MNKNTVKNSLKENMIIKNYKELCIILNEDNKTGNSKKSQLKNWERYFKYHKDGNKFIIDKIYDIPIPAIDKGIYIEEIKNILVNYIYKNKNSSNVVLLSFSKLINILGLVNNTYTIADYKKKELSDILNISLQSIHFFYSSSKNAFKDIVRSALKSLKDKSIIVYEEKHMICEMIEDDSGKMIKNYRLATEKEVGTILDAQNKILDYYEVSTMQELRKLGSSKYNEFMKKVLKELTKEIIEDGININPREYWKFYYKVYSITFGEEAIQREYDKIYDVKLQLNKKSINRLTDKMGIINNTDNEKILVDTLIDLVKYDIELDEKIQELYITNRQNAHYKSFVEILESEKLKLQAEQTMQDFESRNDIDDMELNLYNEKIKDRKKNKEKSKNNIDN